MFGVIIFIHELGHFIAAKCTGVRVNEFAMGMGPKLFSFGKKETVYSLRLFPIGGFCAMEGEDEGAPTPSAFGGNGDRKTLPPEEENIVPSSREKSSRSFAEKRVWQRVIIVVAGAFMNLVLGFALLLAYCGICTLPNENGDRLYATSTIYGFHQNALSEQSGLEVGDTILQVDGKIVLTDMDLASILQSDKDGVFSFTVRRNGERITLPNVQFELQKNEETGKQALIYDFILVGQPQTFGNTITQAAKMEGSVAMMVWRSLGSILTGEYGLNDLSGPIGTVDIIGQVVDNAVTQSRWQAGLGSVLMLLAMITVNVGVFNLLPVPALDGGRLIFLLYEAVTRRPVPAKYEGIVHLVGMVLLLLLMVIIAFSDIRKLIG